MNKVLQVLEAFGLTKKESEIYAYLAKTGSQSSKDLVKALGITKQQVCRVLRSLQDKGVIVSDSQMVEIVTAISFEEILNLYLKSSKDRVQMIAKNKNELLAIWKDIKFKVK